MRLLEHGRTGRWRPGIDEGNLDAMKVLVPLLIAAAALAGCVAYPYEAVPPSGQYYSRPAPPPHGWRHDYDGDGVPDRYDRRPENPYRY